MRILQCIPTLEGGGAERQLCYLAKGLTDTGHAVQVVTMRGGVNEKRLRATPATVEVLTDLSPASPATWWRLWRAIRRFRPDVVQSWICQMDVWGGLAARWTGTPWVLSERCSRQMYPPTFKNRVRRRVAQGVSVVVANSQAGEAYWREELGVRSVLTRVIPNALPLAEIDAEQAVRPDSVGQGERIILYAGRLDAQKNLPVLFRALPAVLNGGAFRVLICGDGPDREKLQGLAVELGIIRRVQFLGYVGNLYALMKAADVFVSVSKFEGQPNAVMEAMACRCPLVISDIPEHREFLDERSALFAATSSSEGVATQLRACLASAEGAQGRATTARRIAERWDIAATARGYLAAYGAILGRGNGGGGS